MGGRRGRIMAGALAVALLLLALQVTGEIIQADEPLTVLDVLLELSNLLVIIGTSVISVLLILRTSAQREESRALRDDLEILRIDNREWREAARDQLQALGACIQRQLEAWRLTTAEQEVAMLLLKGFSHKEIAQLRSTSVATIRQQAASVYDKAGLAGRAELSAFFLEDLMAPTPRPTLQQRAGRNLVAGS